MPTKQSQSQPVNLSFAFSSSFPYPEASISVMVEEILGQIFQWHCISITSCRAALSGGNHTGCARRTHEVNWLGMDSDSDVAGINGRAGFALVLGIARKKKKMICPSAYLSLFVKWRWWSQTIRLGLKFGKELEERMYEPCWAQGNAHEALEQISLFCQVWETHWECWSGNDDEFFLINSTLWPNNLTEREMWQLVEQSFTNFREFSLLRNVLPVILFF